MYSIYKNTGFTGTQYSTLSKEAFDHAKTLGGYLVETSTDIVESISQNTDLNMGYPEGYSIKTYREITQQERLSAIELAVDFYLEDLIKSYKFTSQANIGKYVGYVNAFRDIAEALGGYSAEVYNYCEGEVAKVVAGTRVDIPTPDEFLTELPTFIE